jgi:methylmalonic aciduria homocystinuria type C protein
MESDILIIHDYETDPISRRAKIIMQTVAHVSGAAYFYDPKKYITKKENHEKKISMGCCLHPKFGGWCAFRSVFIFKNLTSENWSLEKTEPIDCLNGNLFF